MTSTHTLFPIYRGIGGGGGNKEKGELKDDEEASEGGAAAASDIVVVDNSDSSEGSSIVQVDIMRGNVGGQAAPCLGRPGVVRHLRRR